MMKKLILLLGLLSLLAVEIHAVDVKKLTLPSGAPLTVYVPDQPDGRAVLALPGGGYVYLAVDHEGKASAPFFNERGITLAVLEYRFPEGNPNVPLGDAWEAMKYLRSNGDELGVDLEKVGIMGSSAGGHLAAATSTLAPDAASRPDFQILFYPVICMWDASTVHAGSRDALLGENASEETLRHYSPDLQVDSLTPPAFILLSNDDWAVPAANGVRYYMALNNARQDAVLHVYPSHGHGWGWRETPFSALWQDELSYWLSRLGKE